jgi:hypothetical protein
MITDELRKWAEEFWEFAYSKFGDKAELLAIADRIDAEHKKAIASVMNDALYCANDKDMAEFGWTRLPVDANNEYIRVGDRMQVVDTGLVFNVTLLRLINSGWVVNPANFVPSNLRHYHDPTVEDVLLELEGMRGNGATYEDVVARCDELAKTLRGLLAGESE